LPVPVQGSGAEIKIAEAIEKMNSEKLADVIILGRGGGSLEDLWPFNEEIVARAIYKSEIPIISAVGHETDFSISDFVADLRAPTPSAAAELAVPNIQDFIYTIDTYKDRLKNSLKRKLQLNKLRLEKIMNSKAYKDPLRKVNEYRIVIDNNCSLMQKDVKRKLDTSKQLYLKLLTKLDALSPIKTMQRGFTITQFNGKVIKSAKDLNLGDEVSISFYDGKRKAEIKE
jgi:exodeoxyribonuclease VII large subunit